MQPVGKLYQNDANVLGHGQSHLLEVLCLFLRLGFKFELGQLADAVHQFRHRFTELLGEGFFGDGGVFDNIVQHGGH